MEKQVTTIDIGPRNWQSALGLLLVAVENGTEKGRGIAIGELRNMAKVADMVPELLAALEALISEIDTLAGPGNDDPSAQALCSGFSFRAARAAIAKAKGE